MEDAQKPLFRWVRSIHGFRDPTIERKEDPSHLLMNGGVGGGILFIPDSEAPTFLDKYVEDVQNGVVHFISENRTLVFRMYMDLDIKRFGPSGPIDDKEILDYSKVIHDTVKMFYPPGTKSSFFDIVVLRNANKEIVKKTASADASADNNKECQPIALSQDTGEVSGTTWKTGVHLVWPALEVTQTIALTMREAMLGHLADAFGKMTAKQNPWEEILDEDVFTKNGLRMPYSHKAEVCTECHGKKELRFNCNTCYGMNNGRIDGKRPYTPWRYLTNGKPNAKQLQAFTANPFKAMQRMSIRLLSKEPTPGWKPYPGAPIALATVPSKKQTKVFDPLRQKFVREFTEDAQGVATVRNRVDVPLGDPMYAGIERFIQTMPQIQQWTGIQVYRIFTTEKNNWYHVQVRNDGSRYCLNVKRNHSSNHIYFLVTPHGVVQKCYSTSSQSKTACREFQSELFRIPDSLKAKFWKSDTSLGLFEQERNDTIVRNPGGHYEAARSTVWNLGCQLDTDEEEDYGVLPGSAFGEHAARPPKEDVFQKAVPLDMLVQVTGSAASRKRTSGGAAASGGAGKKRPKKTREKQDSDED